MKSILYGFVCTYSSSAIYQEWWDALIIYYFNLDPMVVHFLKIQFCQYKKYEIPSIQSTQDPFFSKKHVLTMH